MNRKRKHFVFILNFIFFNEIFSFFSIICFKIFFYFHQVVYFWKKIIIFSSKYMQNIDHPHKKLLNSKFTFQCQIYFDRNISRQSKKKTEIRKKNQNSKKLVIDRSNNRYKLKLKINRHRNKYNWYISQPVAFEQISIVSYTYMCDNDDKNACRTPLLTNFLFHYYIFSLKNGFVVFFSKFLEKCETRTYAHSALEVIK